MPSNDLGIYLVSVATQALSQKIAQSGYCSRRQAVKLIQTGAVTVDGQLAQPSERVNEQQHIQIHQQDLPKPAPLFYAIYNKPVGINCNCVAERTDSIVNAIKLPQHAVPVGRLDKDSHGLLLLSNDGELQHKLMHPDFFHEKSYQVQVNQPFDDDFIAQMAQGVDILGQTTRACQVTAISDDGFEIVLTQGLNRQIRRMCKALGYQVIDLKRVAINGLALNDLPIGQWRVLSAAEIALLKQPTESLTR